MNPKNMKQYQELLWLGVKKDKRTSVRGERSTRYINSEHTVFIELTTPPWDLESTEVMYYDNYIGDSERVFKVPDVSSGYEQTVHISTSYLKKIVDNITSQDVVLMVSDDYPLLLAWKDGEDSWRAIIPPRIENE